MTRAPLALLGVLAACGLRTPTPAACPAETDTEADTDVVRDSDLDSDTDVPGRDERRAFVRTLQRCADQFPHGPYAVTETAPGPLPALDRAELSLHLDGFEVVYWEGGKRYRVRYAYEGASPVP